MVVHSLPPKERLKKLKQILEEEEADDREVMQEAASTISILESSYKMPKDELSIFEDYFSGKSDKLEFKSVPISPTRTGERVIIKEVLVPVNDAQTDHGQQQKDDASVSNAAEGSEEHFGSSESKVGADDTVPPSVGDKQQKVSPLKPAGSSNVLNELNELKKEAIGNPNVDKEEIFKAIQQLEQELHEGGKQQQQQQQHQQQQQQQFNPRMNNYGHQSIAPPVPYHSMPMSDPSYGMSVQMQMQQQQWQQQQQMQMYMQQQQDQRAQQQQQQMQVYMQMFQQQTAALEAENHRLQEEISGIHEAASAAQYPPYRHPRGAQLQQNVPAPQAQSGAVGAAGAALAGAAAASEVHEGDDMMSFMTSLPESKRLEKLKIDHLEHMARLRFEKEKLEQEAQINAIKDKLDAEREAQIVKQNHEKWLASQKRQIQALRVQQALVREMPVADPNKQVRP